MAYHNVWLVFLFSFFFKTLPHPSPSLDWLSHASVFPALLLQSLFFVFNFFFPLDEDFSKRITREKNNPKCIYKTILCLRPPQPPSPSLIVQSVRSFVLEDDNEFHVSPSPSPLLLFPHLEFFFSPAPLIHQYFRIRFSLINCICEEYVLS